nr:hypothetical protein GCM10020092_062780 [Actinoplanes digitatis]
MFRKLAGVLAVVLSAAVLAAPPQQAQAASTLSMRGADVSTLQRAVDLGAKYYTAAGAVADPLDILKSAGVNYIRLRVWNNPASGYNNAAKVLAYAKTVKAKGFKLLIDFHYSDTWADPGKQYKPAAWSSHGISALTTDVYNYTYGVCNSLKAQGTTPDSVQIGNEINVGMLWNDGKVVNNDFTNLSLLLKVGYNATKACNSGTQVIIHTANSDSDAHARWFYDGIRAKGVVWDVTALSYYCNWHGTMANMTSVVADMISRYGKPTILAETAAPFTLNNADGTGNSINTACSGYAATWAEPGRRVHRGAERRQGGRRDRRLLLGADVDGGARQRLGPGEHRLLRRRLGQHGRLQLDERLQRRGEVDQLTTPG